MQVRFAQADPGTIPEGFAAEYVRALSTTAGPRSATAVTAVKGKSGAPGVTWSTQTAFVVRPPCMRPRRCVS
jgi:hypothetical protein